MESIAAMQIQNLNTWIDVYTMLMCNDFKAAAESYLHIFLQIWYNEYKKAVDAHAL